MDAGDENSDTLSQGTMRSHRSAYSTSRRYQYTSASTKSPGTATGAAAQPFASAPSAGGGVKGVVRGATATVARVGVDRPMPNIGDGGSEVSRDVGGLQLEEGWDEKFVYKVCQTHATDGTQCRDLTLNCSQVEHVVVSSCVRQWGWVFRPAGLTGGCVVVLLPSSRILFPPTQKIVGIFWLPSQVTSCGEATLELSTYALPQMRFVVAEFC